MKLRELAVEGYQVNRNLNLGRFGDGLSIIYGERGAGKSTVCEFVRDFLFPSGQSNHQVNGYSNGHVPLGYSGSLNIAHPSGEFQLVRNHADNTLRVTPISAYNNANPSAAPMAGFRLQDWAGQINREVFDCVFNLRFGQIGNMAGRLATLLRTQFNVPIGAAGAGDDSTYLAWQHENRDRQTGLDSWKLRIDQLTQEKTSLLSQTETVRLAYQANIETVEREINNVVSQINRLQQVSYQAKLAEVDAEISRLRLLIENAKTNVKKVPVAAPPVDTLASFYQRLDEVDGQIRSWRHIQSEIQTQRVRLRDEMLIWNELTLDSNDHPYHNARAILVALESKVDQVERNAGHWRDAGGAHVDTTQLSHSLTELCHTMREDLYGLCNELAQQYKHIRHKSAAAELKQLRRCYTEMGESIDRLVERRETVVKEIAKVDPSGANAILRAEIKFCQCAQHEGHLAARRRFVGQLAPAAPKYEVVEVNLDTELAQLRLLEQQRVELLGSVGNHDAELSELNRRHVELMRQRDETREASVVELRARLQAVETELVSSNSQYQELLASKTEYVPVPAHKLLTEAGRLLTQVSNGELTQVFLSEGGRYGESQAYSAELQVRDQFGKVLNYSGLDSNYQSLAYLALALATRAELKQQVELPVIIDDAFSQLSADRGPAAFQLLFEFARQGYQVIATTQHRYLSERFPSVPVFEMTPVTPPVTNRFSAPVVESPQTFQTQSVPVSFFPSHAPSPVAYPPAVVPAPHYESQGQSHVTSFHDSAPLATSIPVEAIADPAVFAPAVDDQTRLDKVGLFNPNQLRLLLEQHVVSVGDLLAYDVNQGAGLGVNADQLDQWQSQVWLLTNVPSLRVVDAQVLVGCGVIEPEQLETSHLDQLVERITRFLYSSQGQRFSNNAQEFSRDRIDGWQRAIKQTRFRWGNRRSQHYLRSSQVSSSSSRNGQSRSQHQQNNRQYDSRNSSQRGHGSEREERTRSRSARSGAPEIHRLSESDHERGDRSSSNRERSSSNRDRSSSNRDRSSSNRDRSSSNRDRSSSNRDRSSSNRDRSSSDRDRSSSDRDREPRTSQRQASDNYQSTGAQREQRARMNGLANAAESSRGKSDRPTRTRALPASEKPKATRQTRSKPSENVTASGVKLKFYLELTDHIEAAPSIGPKTAERFEKIGVRTIAEFLKQTAESMATQISYKRISADVVRQWQQQARFVCRVPNLRGHDAQLLVACGITEPEELSTMQPPALFSIIEPFAETKEGLKIIRNGKKPDLEEITDWISWAQHSRSIQAA